MTADLNIVFIQLFEVTGQPILITSGILLGFSVTAAIVRGLLVTINYALNFKPIGKEE